MKCQKKVGGYGQGLDGDDGRRNPLPQGSGGLPGSPVVKTLPSNAGDVGSVSGWGAKTPHAMWPQNQIIKQKQYCNKFNKDLKKNPH